MRPSLLLTRRALIGFPLLLEPVRALAWDYGTVRSKFTAIIRRKRDGPILSEWRSSEYRDFTIIGMSPSGGADDFRVVFTLVHARKVSCELVLEKSGSEAALFGVWFGDGTAGFAVNEVIAAEQDGDLQVARTERMLAPGSYRIEGVWYGARYTEFLRAGGTAELTITIHGIP